MTGWEWDEGEYAALLEAERRDYAWIMGRYGGLSPSESRAAALEWYPYEPRGATCRGLVFHDPAWHWAMSALYGDDYTRDAPDLGRPPDHSGSGGGTDPS
ncbi:hypothetical protein ACFW2X_23410 [Streptomyces antibioticus]|uniref:hypothetical protein n=1 Tax=Streptomyces antibioticus TaxID=1890 RepID=UPI0036AD3B2F